MDPPFISVARHDDVGESATQREQGEAVD